MPGSEASHQRRLRAFDPAGDLPERAAALWTLVQGEERAVARKFFPSNFSICVSNNRTLKLRISNVPK